MIGVLIALADIITALLYVVNAAQRRTAGW